MSLISAEGLTFAYEGSYDNVFENAEFRLDTGWRLGLIGRNGRGKTTLLRLLMGELEHGGTITSSERFGYFPPRIVCPEKNVGEVLSEAAPECEEWQLMRELGRLGFGSEVFGRDYSTLSGGERTRVLLASLFACGSCFPLIDEPTNHLDQEARKLLSRYLASKPGFMLVSHDRRFLDGCVDHVMSINRSDITVEKGNFSTWYDGMKLREESERAENEKLKKEISRLSDAARRASGWSDKIEKSKIGEHAADRGYIGHKSAKMMKRAKSIDLRRNEAAEEKSKLLKNVEESELLSLPALRYHSERLLELEDISISYGGKEVCSGVRFEVRRGDRISLKGPNGSGKSSILRLLLGDIIQSSGRISVSSGLIASYVPQDCESLSGALRDMALSWGIDVTRFLTFLRKLGFERVQFDKDLSDLSAGQRKKVLLARSLCQSAHLYIWDEPLNYIDVFSRIQIEELLIDSGATVIFVEHDAEFSERVSTRTVEL